MAHIVTQWDSSGAACNPALFPALYPAYLFLSTSLIAEGDDKHSRIYTLPWEQKRTSAFWQYINAPNGGYIMTILDYIELLANIETSFSV